MTQPAFALRSRLKPEHFPKLAAEYDYGGDTRLLDELGPRIRVRGYFEREEFLEFCEWKSPRTRPRCAENSEEMVRETTRVALGTPVEQLRVEVLTLLRGVEWPTASVLLHFVFPDRYPILDFRALWSLGYRTPPRYDFRLWQAYTECCRELARSAGVSMRTLDRALWQFSRKHQR
jgi:hypothetical protein